MAKRKSEVAVSLSSGMNGPWQDRSSEQGIARSSGFEVSRLQVADVVKMGTDVVRLISLLILSQNRAADRMKFCKR